MRRWSIVLIFNTAPVAFGALGAPVTVLGAVTGLPATALAAMIGRQLPVIAIILPFYVMALYGGWRSVRALWPVLLVAGGSFAISQFVASNSDRLHADRRAVLARLADRHAALPAGLASRAGPGIRDQKQQLVAGDRSTSSVPNWQGWLPWVVVSVTVILWTSFKLFAIGQQNIAWPGLHRAISITLYNGKPYDAIWAFQPLGTGTAILLAAIITALLVRLSPRAFFSCFGRDHSRSAGSRSSR